MKTSKVKKFFALSYCSILLISTLIPLAYAFEAPTVFRCCVAFATNAFLTYCACAYASDFIGKD